MEEKEKKKKEAQAKASKNYKKTEAGKRSQERSNAKNKCKKFIREFATLEELQEIENIVTERRKELKGEIK